MIIMQAILLAMLKTGYIFGICFVALCLIQLIVYQITGTSLYNKMIKLVFRGW